jgi:pimeloyl-ACP methyl ester carboxylesterase
VGAASSGGVGVTATNGSALRRRYVDTRFGQMHVVECGEGEPVLFLHQTPRSWWEFAEVLPLVGRGLRGVAIDTLGFGQSARPPEPMRIEVLAAAVVAVSAALGLDAVSAVGHHTGAVVALEAAAQAPERVRSLVLSGMPYVDEARRRRVRARPPIDEVTPRPDGAHLVELWARRRSFYASGEEIFLTRFVRDALQAAGPVEDGHRAVNAYHMEDRLPLVRARVLLLCGEDDAFSRPDLPALESALRCRSVLIARAGVALPEQRPQEFAREVLDFVTGG